MRTGVEIRLSADDRKRLEAIVASGNSPQKHVWRARIVLLSADGVGTVEIQRRTGKAKPTIWRWQRRFKEAGVEQLVAAIMMDNGLADQRAQVGHPIRKPLRDAAAVQRKVGRSGFIGHQLNCPGGIPRQPWAKLKVPVLFSLTWSNYGLDSAQRVAEDAPAGWREVGVR